MKKRDCLPRQARDKHKDNSKQRPVPFFVQGPHCGPDGGCPVPLGGKHGALSIGQMIREAGFGGSFMFEVDYDAAGANNLLTWLDRGMRGGAGAGGGAGGGAGFRH